MLRRLALLLLLGVLSFTAPLRAEDKGAEKWADSALPVTDGLELWLDAGRLNAARKAHGEKEIADGEKVETWYDASGRGRNLTQKNADVRPTFLAVAAPALLFDGDGAYLALNNAGQSYKDATVIVVAAPFSNPGDFRAVLAMNQNGKNDYTTGLNLDLGPAPSPRFTALNVEGAGFGGVSNLLHDASDFGAIRRLALTSTVGPGGVKLFADGRANGKRDRGDSLLHMDNFIVGARCLNNDGGPANVRCFLSCGVLQVLVYDRVLSEAELAKVDEYLAGRQGKTAKLTSPPKPIIGKPLVIVADPPPVQMLVPGFTVRQLPIDLTNINNVRYRPDGKLVALAYNGDVYLLSDSKGTGLEDKVERFWESKGALRGPIGMALTPPGYKLGQGVFVASKGKISLIVDTDGDDKADKEIIVADGWKEIPQAVDAIGVALDKDENLYFGLGTANYANPYVVDEHGRANYDVKSERGTILRVSPDFSKREIVATGVRFTIGLAFNRDGDLFATDQEGATWLANGNPLDELLHIQQGRHYGFPPRHPKHLPNVIDEPSVFDYGPQHQSTCGLTFDESVNKGPIFGPAWWQGDALIAGYSRGKLYRTKLAKTPAGYVARTDILACLGMLTLDACVSPAGDLVVVCHSGEPDWGTGPSGRGKLYKISYVGKTTPQPVLTWAAGPREVRVAFDAPLDPADLKGLAGKASIEYGKYVRPGDRFEVKRPGYEAVKRQLKAPRFDLPIRTVGVTGDRRTLILSTDAQPEAAYYALSLPGMGRSDKPDPHTGESPQNPVVDLGYDLSGVDISWRAKSGDGAWTGWLPHLDLSVARVFTAGSADHDRLWELLKQPGTLTLRTKLDLWQMLRPAVQPGSTLDYTLPDEDVTVTLTATGPLDVKSPLAVVEGGNADAKGRRQVRIKVRPKKDELLSVEITLETGAAASLEATYATNEDARPRALPLGRLLVPWASVKRLTDPLVEVERDLPELKGGDWTRGREIFFNEQNLCVKCHQMRGRGGRIGPDLSNLIHRDYESVLRDIHSPSAAINPDYITYFVELKDGRVLQGVLRTEGDALVIGDQRGQQVMVKRADVETLKPSAVSTMPEGIDKTLGPDRMRDLLTFLLTEAASTGGPGARRGAAAAAPGRGGSRP